MPEIILSRQAVEDLDRIYDFVAESSPQNADMLIRQFQNRLEFLAANPFIGRPRPELMDKVRSWNLHRFVIFYLPATAPGIEVIRILHAAMDISRKQLRSSNPPPPPEA